MALIEVKDLGFIYKDGSKALKGLSVNIYQGKKVAILGPNGAGKSTLLLHLNGIHLAQEGSVSYSGEIINAKNEKNLRSKVGLVFQDSDDQVFSTTVWEDVAFGPTNMGLGKKEIEQCVNDSLAAVDMLMHKDKVPHRLSYGQKKRIAIAGVLAMNPEIIILDEPTAFLDPQGKDSLFSVLDDLNQRGRTIVIATHDVNLAVEWADEVIIIKDGQCIAQGGIELLMDEKIVTKAQLHYPILAKLFRQLPELNLEILPKTIEEAVKVIRQLKK